MNRNVMLYNAAKALIECARFVRPLDSEYSQELLNKATEFKDKIVINEDVEKEVIDFASANQAGSEIEFVYKKSNKNQITQINKKTKHTSLKEQQIDFHFTEVDDNQSSPINFLANLVSI